MDRVQYYGSLMMYHRPLDITDFLERCGDLKPTKDPMYKPCYIVFNDNDQPVGIASLFPGERDSSVPRDFIRNVFVDFIAVDPNFRQMGYGTSLLSAVLEDRKGVQLYFRAFTHCTEYINMMRLCGLELGYVQPDGQIAYYTNQAEVLTCPSMTP